MCHAYRLSNRLPVYLIIATFLAISAVSLAQEQPPAPGTSLPPCNCPMMVQRAGGPPVVPHRPGMPHRMPAPRMGALQPEVPPPGGVAPGPEAQRFVTLRRPDVQKELGITPAQRDKLEQIGFENAKAEIQGRASLEVLRLELGRLVRGENPDRTAVDKKIQEISQAQASLMRSGVMAELDARGVLTAEQRARLPQVIQKLVRPPAPRPAREPAVPSPAAPPKEKPKPAAPGDDR